MKIIGTVVIASLLLASGCASFEASLAKCDAEMSKPLASGDARICFVRESAMLDAILAYYVFDAGSDVNYDSALFAWMKSGTFVQALPHRTSFTPVGIPQLYMYKTEPSGQKQWYFLGKTGSSQQAPPKKMLAELHVAKTPNVRYLGDAKSGGTIVFDRPVGITRLSVRQPNGAELPAPDYRIEAGKKYVVRFRNAFSGTHFALIEQP